MRRLFLISAALLFGGLLHSQSTFPFHAVFIDSESGDPIQFAILRFFPGEEIASTNRLGEVFFEFQNEPDSIEFSHILYKAILPFHTSNENETSGLQEFRLKAIPLIVLDCPVYASDLYENNRSEQPMSVVSIRRGDFERDDQSSMLFTINDVPGVRFESRGYGGSRRINIRGSMLRSPFAVRNIKIYYDEFPLTSPDGQSALELLDAFDLGSLTVIKGPASNTFGAGSAGALRAHSLKNEYRDNMISLGLSAGSYGYLRSANEVTTSDDEISFRFSHIHQETSGYRQQEYNRRQQFSLNLRYEVSNKLDYFVWATRYSGRWALPGALTLEEYEENPRQADPDAIRYHAEVNRYRTRGGITQRYTARRVQILTTVFGNQSSKINPYGTSQFFNGYKDETAQGAGLRNVVKFRIADQIDSREFRASARMITEYTTERSALSEFDNDNGSAGILRYENETQSEELTLGGDLRLSRKRWLAITGITWAQRGLDSQNEVNQLDSNSLGYVDRNFNQLLSRASLSYKLFEHTYIYGSIGSGFSPPSLFELIDPATGILSENLEAEHWLNYECGIRSEIKGFTTDFNAYRQAIDRAILPFEEAEYSVFKNSDGLELEGMELRVTWGKHLSAPLNSIALTSSGALQNYRYTIEGLERQHLPGVPRSTFTAGGSLRAFEQVEAHIQFQWSDLIYADTQNTASLPAYKVINLSFNWELPLHLESKWNAEVSGGGMNLLNEQYTSFVTYNSFGGRYYNPMPGITFWGGIRIKRIF